MLELRTRRSKLAPIVADAEHRRDDLVVSRWHDDLDAVLPQDPDAPQHVLWAADVWYSIKKHWCLEAQNRVRAQRAGA